MFMTLKDYSKSRGITYEAVRRQLKQYADDLQDHVRKQGKVYLLDDKAVTILDGHRINKTVIVEPTDGMLKDEMERLRAEIDQLKSQVIALQNDKLQYIQDKARQDALLLIADKEHDELEQTRQQLTVSRVDLERTQQELEQARQELTDKDAELSSYTKTFFGLYRKS